MNNYAKIVLWLGLFMIVAGITRNWSVFSATIFGSGNPPGLVIPGPGGLPIPKGGCPPGYHTAFGRCWSPAVNPIPPRRQNV